MKKTDYLVNTFFVKEENSEKGIIRREKEQHQSRNRGEQKFSLKKSEGSSQVPRIVKAE